MAHMTPSHPRGICQHKELRRHQNQRPKDLHGSVEIRHLVIGPYNQSGVSKGMFRAIEAEYKLLSSLVPSECKVQGGRVASELERLGLRPISKSDMALDSEPYRQKSRANCVGLLNNDGDIDS